MIWTIIGIAIGVIGIILAIIFAKKSSTKKDIKLLGEKIENIPQNIIINSEDYNRLAKEIQELEELIQASLDVNNNLKLSDLLKKKQQQLESLKENVNRLHETFNKITLNTERLRQAKAYFDAGKFREADDLLNAEEIASEVEQLQDAIGRKGKEIEKLREDLIDKSNEYLIKAQIWTTLYSEPNWYENAKKYFDESLKAARTKQALFDYAQFLSEHEQKYAILLYEELLIMHRNLAIDNPKENVPVIAAILHNLGKIHDDINEYPKALEEYEEALGIFRSLENDNPQKYLPFVGNTLSCLGSLHSDIKEYSEALNIYEEALKIFKRLNTDNPKEYLSDVAHTLNSMGIIHSDIKEYAEALEKYKESLGIFINLADDNPKTYLPYGVKVIVNMGSLFSQCDEYSQALKSYETAMGILKTLTGNDKNVFSPDMAGTSYNIGCLYKKNNEYSKALENFEESSKMYRVLANYDHKSYFQNAVDSLDNLIDVLSKIGKNYYNQKNYIEAEKYFTRCVEIGKELEIASPNADLFDVADALHKLGELHSERKEYSKALNEYEESLKIFRNLTNDNLKPFSPPLIMSTLIMLGNIHSENKEYQKAVAVYEEASEICKNIVDDDPKLYLPALTLNYGILSQYYLFTKEYSKSEQSALLTLKLDNTRTIVKTNLAHALLFQNRFTEAEAIYKELSQTNKTYTKTLLDELKELEKANVIPTESKADVEKIKKILNDKKKSGKRYGR